MIDPGMNSWLIVFEVMIERDWRNDWSWFEDWFIGIEVMIERNWR